MAVPATTSSDEWRRKKDNQSSNRQRKNLAKERRARGNSGNVAGFHETVTVNADITSCGIVEKCCPNVAFNSHTTDADLEAVFRSGRPPPFAITSPSRRLGVYSSRDSPSKRP
ncbi:hypothetical protein K0M31_020103 [Melipona bicolor]|uniref:Uncharacterized protein n=1 Tax=Melipona bicolor TaxID=60889 RepID=A0AA40KQG7_9HYME|nr:hypothetical protein K0M31_020103 [Melipona bicolor]